MHDRDVLECVQVPIRVALQDVAHERHCAARPDVTMPGQSLKGGVEVGEGRYDDGSILGRAEVPRRMRIHDDRDRTGRRAIGRCEECADRVGHRYRIISMSATRKASSRLCSRFSRGSHAVS